MRNLILSLSVFTLLVASIACNNAKSKEEMAEVSEASTGKVEVYYFHNTRRCATCTAVEDVTKESLEELYSEELENENMVFTSINLEEADSKEIIEKLDISGQTLLIVYGKKKENLTTDAFMNARSNPEKLKELLKSTIDSLVTE